MLLQFKKHGLMKPPNVWSLIPGYTFISKPKKSSKTGGGLGIFVKNNLSYKTRDPWVDGNRRLQISY